MSNFKSNDFLLGEMLAKQADGVDFVPLFSNDLCPIVYETWTKEQLMSEKPCGMPRTGRRYWKIIEGRKEYVD